MRLLAVDTTSVHGSIALLDDEGLAGHQGFRTTQPRHAESLLPSLSELMSRIGWSLADLDALAVAVGPGSFTGLRIGIASVEGLSYALARPVIGISTLDATAYRYRFRQGLIVALIDAYRGDVYACSYRADGKRVQPIGEPQCVSPRVFLDALDERPVLIAGSATVSHRDVVAECVPGDDVIADASLFLAEDIGRLARPRLEAGESAELGGLDALYIRQAAAQPMRERESGIR